MLILKRLFGIAIPAMINMILAEVMLEINLAFAGRLNDAEMQSGIGLANSIIYAFPVTIAIGLAAVL